MPQALPLLLFLFHHHEVTMRLKSKKISPIKAALIRKEITELQEEICLMPRVSAMRDITPELRAGLEQMAANVGLPVELFAPNYAAFQAMNLRLRIGILEAQLAEGSLH
ncbi:MAG: hypothetical protein KA533_02450 [Sphingobium sp.]|nr:hypothetical protein [Sphingobium sp.]MBP6113073.1 hypothetical protein [Sphingobium sp.]MBP8672202.1 hypothetical protein [Sphingobium sp.]MBP9156335.1 hypothetical protein [Sphingobium sp.]